MADPLSKELRRHEAPVFETEKGLSFYAKDSDGFWYYVNHAHTWQTCPPPVSREEAAIPYMWECGYEI